MNSIHVSYSERMIKGGKCELCEVRGEGYKKKG